MAKKRQPCVALPDLYMRRGYTVVNSLPLIRLLASKKVPLGDFDYFEAMSKTLIIESPIYHSLCYYSQAVCDKNKFLSHSVLNRSVFVPPPVSTDIL